MAYKNFEHIMEKVKERGTTKRVVVAGAEEGHVLEAVFHAQRNGIVTPVLVGDVQKTQALINTLGYGSEPCELIPPGDMPVGERAVALIREGRGDILMKGLCETRDFLKPVVSKQNGLTGGRLISHFTLAEVPGYHKLLALSDAAVVIQPSLEEKKQILENAASTLRSMGYQRPKVAVACAIETVNSQIQETVDAAELVRLWEQGEIPGCDLAGPLSYDLIVDSEAADIKGVSCPWCGDFDLMIVPQMTTGNMLIKCWNACGGKVAGIIVGAGVPIVLASRSASAEGKFLSLVLAAACDAEEN